jgi:hypothetical protein
VASPTATAIPPAEAAQLTATAAAMAFPTLEQRPLHLPTLTPGAACPLVPAQRLPYAWATYGPALGQGPVFALGFNPDGTFDVAPAANFGSTAGWGGDKLVWVSAPGDTGPVEVRGRQLDGPHPLRFNGGFDESGDLTNAPLLPVLHLYWGQNDTNNVGTYVRMQASGCYGMQVDGQSFNEVIVFQAIMH